MRHLGAWLAYVGLAILGLDALSFSAGPWWLIGSGCLVVGVLLVLVGRKDSDSGRPVRH